MSIFLDLTSGICWSLVYVIAIVLSCRKKTWFIPNLAICQNVSWEFLAVVNQLRFGIFGLAFFTHLAWLLLDIGVLLSWLLQDQKGNNAWLRKTGLLAVVSTAIYYIAWRFGEWEIVSFFINAVMSLSFVIRFFREQAVGISTWIAVLKLVGTLAATVLYGWILFNPVTLWLGGLCFILDSYYISLILSKKMAEIDYEQD